VSDSRVELVGGAAAMADLRRWADQVAPAVARAAGPFAERVADTVRSRVPHLTGQLAGSVEAGDDDEGGPGSIVALGGGVPYAGWIEFGGSRGRPYVPEGRYLYPTALEARDEYATLAADTAADTVGRFPWSTPAL
jgi:hypothetical protein